MAYSSRLMYVCMHTSKRYRLSPRLVQWSMSIIKRCHTISFQIEPAEGRGAPEANALVFTSVNLKDRTEFKTIFYATYSAQCMVAWRIEPTCMYYESTLE